MFIDSVEELCTYRTPNRWVLPTNCEQLDCPHRITCPQYKRMLAFQDYYSNKEAIDSAFFSDYQFSDEEAIDIVWHEPTSRRARVFKRVL